MLGRAVVLAAVIGSATSGLAAQDSTRVWVNARSGVYHCPGTTYYGKTTRGDYLPESTARSLGFRANGGKACGAPAPDTAQRADAAPTLPDSGLVSCAITRIKDADTIECDGLGPVRLIGVDSPEDDQQPFGDAATAGFASLAPVGTRLLLEIGAEERDQYKRLLAYLWLDGSMLNWSLVRHGWAVAYPYKPNTKYARQFEQAESAAKGEGRGLWAINGFACRPVDHRRMTC